MEQYAWVIDVLLVLGMLGIGWCVSSEGLWGAALMFVNVMFAGLVAFDLYEPVAKFIDLNLGFMAAFADFVALVLLFAIAFTVIRIATDNLGPTMVRFPTWVYHIGRYGFAGATAWYLMGMILCILQTAPIHKQFLGYKWDTHAVWTAGVDRFWLGYVQTTTERVFDRSPPKMFDAKSKFIREYHDRRDFGDPDPDFAPKKAGGAAPQAGQPPAGGGAPAGAAAPAPGAPAPGRQPATVGGVVGVPGQ
ncbi:MAG: hypothetical protein HY000_30440 [Planctomycetes bacterium]|nr:hypothetical protein [Planctomycetota bacterium]